MTARYHLSVDEFNRWRVFDVNDALGEFRSWAEADEFRKSCADSKCADDTPAWNPKSGGY